MQEAFSLTQINPSSLSSPTHQPQHKKTQMYQLIRSFSPTNFLTIKSSFSLYDKSSVTVSQFVTILLSILHKNNPSSSSSIKSQILTLIQLFSYINYQNKQKIKFQDFTNFIIDNEEIFTEEENFEEYKIVYSKELNGAGEITGSKIFTLGKSEYLGVLEGTQKSMKLYSTRKMEEYATVSLNGITIINVVYVVKSNSIVLSTNDKYLNFYDLGELKPIKRFFVPDIQLFLIVNQQKQLLFSGTPSGKLYLWSLKQIFLDKKHNIQPNELYKKFFLKEPIKEQQDLTCMIEIPESQLIITGSNDCLIRLYSTKDNSINLLKKLQCHPKGIKGITYSFEYKIIISCAFDFDILIWNAYLEYPIAKLIGHEESLNSVYCPKNHPVILSLDSKGIMKIWNIKSFQLLQTINTSETFLYDKVSSSKTNQLVSKGEDINKTSINFAYKQQFDVGIICLKKLSFYEFVINHDPKLTDDNELIALTYSPLNLEIYIGSDRDLRIWSMNKGVLIRQFKKRTLKKIVSLCLDKFHRRIFLGTIEGEIVSINIFTGIILNKYFSHTRQISSINYSEKHSLLISHGWEGIIKIHNDTDHLEKIDKRGNVLRNIKNLMNKDDTILGSYSDNMMLIASAARSNECYIWDFEKGFFERKFTIIEEISYITFLNPYPLILICDLKGGVHIFVVKYHKKEGELLVSWNNMYSIQKQAQVNVASSDYYKGELTIVLGDEYGYVRVIKIEQALTNEKIGPIGPEVLGNKNPYRIEDYQYKSFQNTGKNTTTNNPNNNTNKTAKTQLTPLQPQKTIRTLLQIKAHNERITQILLLRQTTSPFTLLTAGEKICKLWNQKGENIGILRQGYLVNPNWKFQLHGGYRTKEEILYEQVNRDLEKSKEELKYLKREKMIPFSSLEDEFESVDQIDDNQIYRNLKEIEEYLGKKNPKSTKRLY